MEQIHFFVGLLEILKGIEVITVLYPKIETSRKLRNATIRICGYYRGIAINETRHMKTCL